VDQIFLADGMAEITGHPLPLDVPLHNEILANGAGRIMAAQAELRRFSLCLEEGLQEAGHEDGISIRVGMHGPVPHRIDILMARGACLALLVGKFNPGLDHSGPFTQEQEKQEKRQNP
jgi:hypothetical protein